MIDSITGKTKLYGVIGDPIGHSLSPIFQNYLLRKNNLDGIYIPLRISPSDLEKNIGLLRNNFSGFNVTIPHKENIMKYLDEIHPLAQRYGAVNTVKVVNNKLIGYNTDGIGFVRSLLGFELNDREVLLLGAGGAAKVIASEIVDLGGKLTIVNRNLKRAEDIRDSIEKHFHTSISIGSTVHRSFEMIVNCTSLGMYPNVNESPLDMKFLKGSEMIYDLIYNPFETKLIKHGMELGINTINGLSMLMHQGIKSFEIWTDSIVPSEEYKQIYVLLRKELII